MNPRGQTLVLAALMGLVVAVALLATLQVGVAVHQRVQLQDSADAAVYSVAALEARAFNFYGYANRTQASHYTSAMLLQSLLSFAFFTESFLTDVYGVMRTLDPCSGEEQGLWRVTCPALEGLPVVGPALRFLEGALGLLEGLVVSYQQTLRLSGLDEQIGGEAIPMLRTMNSALALISTSVMKATLRHVQTGAQEVLAANTSGLPPPDWKGSALSACMFDRAHLRESNGSPLAPVEDPSRPLLPRAREEWDRRAHAKRTMAQIANASRHGCDGGGDDCPVDFATRRSLDALAVPSWMAPLRSLLASVPKWGTSRLLTHRLGRGLEDPEGGNYLREPTDTPGAGMAMLAQGDVLGADDPYSLSLGPARLGALSNPLACEASDSPQGCWGDPRYGKREDRPYRYLLESSVWAGGDDEPGFDRGGVHWRIAHRGWPLGRGWHPPTAPGALGGLGLNAVSRRLAPGVSVTVWVANVRPIMDGNHRWPGLAPFMHFEPGQFAAACDPSGTRNGEARWDRATARNREFNQPSAWVLLGATGAGQPRFGPWMLNAAGKLEALGGSLEFRRPGTLGALDTTVLARAQAYYHRPGNWTEPPNFFNPYWRPRLASVWQGRDENPLIEQLVEVLPDPLRSAPQRVVTH
ncbi:MAG: Tad domain-containing protein [Myxococcota bacterium]|nr:Tad domain-containing protein [Myxococcota bacterium]